MRRSGFVTSVACGVLSLLIAVDGTASQHLRPPPGSFGKLNDFYRAMQLQGNLVILGQGLVTPPNWLESHDLDIRYRPKANSPDGREVIRALRAGNLAVQGEEEARSRLLWQLPIDV